MTQILIADDNAINRKLLAWQLETLGFACDNATCGRDTIEACTGKQFDIIFLDVNLGDMDGYEVTRTLRERERETRTPIVAVTAHVGREERERCINSGMDDFLSKPITIGPLALLLVRWGVCGYEAGGEAAGAQVASGDNSGLWLLPGAVTWLRELERGSAHAGLTRELADDFVTRAAGHLREMRAAHAAGDADAGARFALYKNSVGIGAARLAAAVGESRSPDADGSADGEAWLAEVERILSGTRAEIEREFM